MKKRLFAVLLLIMLIGVVAGCGGGGEGTAEKDTIVVGLQAEPVTLDPAQMTDFNSTRVVVRFMIL